MVLNDMKQSNMHFLQRNKINLYLKYPVQSGQFFLYYIFLILSAICCAVEIWPVFTFLCFLFNVLITYCSLSAEIVIVLLIHSKELRKWDWWQSININSVWVGCHCRVFFFLVLDNLIFIVRSKTDAKHGVFPANQ